MKKRQIITDEILPIDVPREVAICPICDASLQILGVDEWESETGRPIHFDLECDNFPGFSNSRKFKEFMNGHYSMPYVDWLPVWEVVRKWLFINYRMPK